VQLGDGLEQLRLEEIGHGGCVVLHAEERKVGSDPRTQRLWTQQSEASSISSCLERIVGRPLGGLLDRNILWA
jgi:hypothetical protein